MERPYLSQEIRRFVAERANYLGSLTSRRVNCWLV